MLAVPMLTLKNIDDVDSVTTVCAAIATSKTKLATHLRSCFKCKFITDKSTISEANVGANITSTGKITAEPQL